MSNQQVILLEKQQIEEIFEDEGFRKRYFSIFEIDEGIKDPVTGKKAPWTISWQLDNGSSCEYVDVATEAALREELANPQHQADLAKSRAAYLQKKCMQANKFNDECTVAKDEIGGLVAALKSFGGSDLSVQPDFYEDSMFCIVRGTETIEGESDYDERCLAGSMDEKIAKSVVRVLKESAISVGHVNTLSKNGAKMVEVHVALVDKLEVTQDALDNANKTLALRDEENSSLRKKLDRQIAAALQSGGDGNGNVTVADPEKFAKVLRVLEVMSDDIERVKKGQEVEGLPVSGSNALSKELLKFNEMIKRILASVHGE